MIRESTNIFPYQVSCQQRKCPHFYHSVEYRPQNNRFDFHEDKLAKRNATIAARGHYTLSKEERVEFMRQLEMETLDTVTPGLG